MRSAHKFCKWQICADFTVCVYHLSICVVSILLSFLRWVTLSRSNNRFRLNKAQIFNIHRLVFYRPCRYGSFQLALKRCPLSQHIYDTCKHTHSHNGQMNTYSEWNETSHKVSEWMLNRVANNPDIYMRKRCCFFFFLFTSFFFIFLFCFIFNEVHYWKLLLLLLFIMHNYVCSWHVSVHIGMLCHWFECLFFRCKARRCTTIIPFTEWKRINLQVNQFINPANCDCIYSVRLIFIFVC